MSPLPYLVVLAVAGGQVDFTGAVVTPTAQSAPATVQDLQHGTRGLTSYATHLDGPPRTIKIQAPKQAGGGAEVVVTYL